MTAIILNLSPNIELTDEQFLQICRSNPELRLERTDCGELIIMPPTGWETGNRNSRLTQRLGNWTDADGSGLAFDSSTGFTLPNGADRSPDAAWVRQERLPKNLRVEIYRIDQDVEILHAPTSLSGEDVLPGFILDLANILI